MAQEQDILSQAFRQQIIEEIIAPENDYRKEESRRRFDVYRGNTHEIVLDEMAEEYSQKTVQNIRAITSINLVPRIISEKGSLYKNKPKRMFNGLSDEQIDYVNDLYGMFKFNENLRKANHLYKLQDQLSVQIMPQMDELKLRVLQPHHYDVIPKEDDPTKPMCFIISLNDETKHISTYQSSTERKRARDYQNQMIGDWDDVKKAQARFAWWSENFNFITNGFGDIQSGPETENSLGQLNLIDVADDCEKDFRYWIMKESNLVRFEIDFCKMLTDLAETMKMQGAPTGLLISTSKPELVNIGPRKFMYLALDPNAPEARPSFDFKNPNPDLTAQMQIIQDLLAMYLSSDHVDPKTVSGSLDASNKFSSGIERLLHQLQRFEASKEDADLFERVEQELYQKFVAYNNLLASNGVGEFRRLPEDSFLEIEFERPSKLETQEELEARQIRLLQEGLTTKTMALEAIYHVSKDKALELKQEIDSDVMGFDQIGGENVKPHTHTLPDGTLSGMAVATGPGLHTHQGLEEAENGPNHRHRLVGSEDLSGPPQ